MATATIETEDGGEAVSSDNNNEEKRKAPWEGADAIGTRVDNVKEEGVFFFFFLASLFIVQQGSGPMSDIYMYGSSTLCLFVRGFRVITAPGMERSLCGAKWTVTA